MKSKLFDIVITVGPKDEDIIRKQLVYNKKNIIGYRNIYLICKNPHINIDGCITIDEKLFPFQLETVFHFTGLRKGWFLQQLLKLYAGFIIPDIMDRYLVIDADTFFLKPTTFIENNKCLYNYGKEYTKRYFEHMLRLDKDLIRVHKDKSGVVHHMIFEKKYIRELFLKIEKNHNDTFYNIFLKNIQDPSYSSASEYEIYFNYMLKNHHDKIKIRNLKWKNSRVMIHNRNLDYISIHHHMRNKK